MSDDCIETEPPGGLPASLDDRSARDLARRLSICVCTTGRRRELIRCLRSIRAASAEVEILVSDDAESMSGCAAVAADFSAKYFTGPRSGVSANRNAVIAASSREWVMLLDDDGLLGQDALDVLGDYVNHVPAGTVITGVVDEPTGRVAVSAPSYLGFFRRYRSGPIESINLNANLFPVKVFREVGFDCAIEFGYEDMDLCAGLLARGFRIAFAAEFVNCHRPRKGVTPDRNRAARRARFYVGIRRRLKWSNHPLAAGVFCVVATLHEGASLVRRRENPWMVLVDMAWAMKIAWRKRRVVDVALRGVGCGDVEELWRSSTRLDYVEDGGTPAGP